MFLLTTKNFDYICGSPFLKNIVYAIKNNEDRFVLCNFNKWIKISSTTEAVRVFSFFNAVEAKECDKDKYIDLAKKEIADLRDVRFMNVYIDPNYCINSAGITNYTKHI